MLPLLGSFPMKKLTKEQVMSVFGVRQMMDEQEDQEFMLDEQLKEVFKRQPIMVSSLIGNKYGPKVKKTRRGRRPVTYKPKKRKVKRRRKTTTTTTKRRRKKKSIITPLTKEEEEMERMRWLEKELEYTLGRPSGDEPAKKKYFKKDRISHENIKKVLKERSSIIEENKPKRKRILGAMIAISLAKIKQFARMVKGKIKKKEIGKATIKQNTTLVLQYFLLYFKQINFMENPSGKFPEIADLEKKNKEEKETEKENYDFMPQEKMTNEYRLKTANDLKEQTLNQSFFDTMDAKDELVSLMKRFVLRFISGAPREKIRKIYDSLKNIERDDVINKKKEENMTLSYFQSKCKKIYHALIKIKIQTFQLVKMMWDKKFEKSVYEVLEKRNLIDVIMMITRRIFLNVSNLNVYDAEMEFYKEEKFDISEDLKSLLDEEPMRFIGRDGSLLSKLAKSYNKKEEEDEKRQKAIRALRRSGQTGDRGGEQGVVQNINRAARQTEAFETFTPRSRADVSNRDQKTTEADAEEVVNVLTKDRRFFLNTQRKKAQEEKNKMDNTDTLPEEEEVEEEGEDDDELGQVENENKETRLNAKTAEGINHQDNVATEEKAKEIPRERTLNRNWAQSELNWMYKKVYGSKYDKELREQFEHFRKKELTFKELGLVWLLDPAIKSALSNRFLSSMTGAIPGWGLIQDVISFGAYKVGFYDKFGTDRWLVFGAKNVTEGVADVGRMRMKFRDGFWNAYKGGWLMGPDVLARCFIHYSVDSVGQKIQGCLDRAVGKVAPTKIANIYKEADFRIGVTFWAASVDYVYDIVKMQLGNFIAKTTFSIFGLSAGWSVALTGMGVAAFVGLIEGFASWSQENGWKDILFRPILRASQAGLISAGMILGTVSDLSSIFKGASAVSLFGFGYSLTAAYAASVYSWMKEMLIHYFGKHLWFRKDETYKEDLRVGLKYKDLENRLIELEDVLKEKTKETKAEKKKLDAEKQGHKAKIEVLEDEIDKLDVSLKSITKKEADANEKYKIPWDERVKKIKEKKEKEDIIKMIDEEIENLMTKLKVHVVEAKNKENDIQDHLGETGRNMLTVGKFAKGTFGNKVISLLLSGIATVLFGVSDNAAFSNYVTSHLQQLYEDRYLADVKKTTQENLRHELPAIMNGSKAMFARFLLKKKRREIEKKMKEAMEQKNDAEFKKLYEKAKDLIKKEKTYSLKIINEQMAEAGLTNDLTEEKLETEIDYMLRDKKHGGFSDIEYDLILNEKTFFEDEIEANRTMNGIIADHLECTETGDVCGSEERKYKVRISRDPDILERMEKIRNFQKRRIQFVEYYQERLDANDRLDARKQEQELERLYFYRKAIQDPRKSSKQMSQGKGFGPVEKRQYSKKIKIYNRRRNLIQASIKKERELVEKQMKIESKKKRSDRYNGYMDMMDDIQDARPKVRLTILGYIIKDMTKDLTLNEFLLEQKYPGDGKARERGGFDVLKDIITKKLPDVDPDVIGKMIDKSATTMSMQVAIPMDFVDGVRHVRHMRYVDGKGMVPLVQLEGRIMERYKKRGLDKLSEEDVFAIDEDGRQLYTKQDIQDWKDVNNIFLKEGNAEFKARKITKEIQANKMTLAHYERRVKRAGMLVYKKGGKKNHANAIKKEVNDAKKFFKKTIQNEAKRLGYLRVDKDTQKVMILKKKELRKFYAEKMREQGILVDGEIPVEDMKPKEFWKAFKDKATEVAKERLFPKFAKLPNIPLDGPEHFQFKKELHAFERKNLIPELEAENETLKNHIIGIKSELKSWKGQNENIHVRKFAKIATIEARIKNISNKIKSNKRHIDSLRKTKNATKEYDVPYDAGEEATYFNRRREAFKIKAYVSKTAPDLDVDMFLTTSITDQDPYKKMINKAQTQMSEYTQKKAQLVETYAKNEKKRSQNERMDITNEGLKDLHEQVRLIERRRIRQLEGQIEDKKFRIEFLKGAKIQENAYQEQMAIVSKENLSPPPKYGNVDKTAYSKYAFYHHIQPMFAWLSDGASYIMLKPDVRYRMLYSETNSGQIYENGHKISLIGDIEIEQQFKEFEEKYGVKMDEFTKSDVVSSPRKSEMIKDIQKFFKERKSMLIKRREERSSILLKRQEERDKMLKEVGKVLDKEIPAAAWDYSKIKDPQLQRIFLKGRERLAKFNADQEKQERKRREQERQKKQKEREEKTNKQRKNKTTKKEGIEKLEEDILDMKEREINYNERAGDQEYMEKIEPKDTEAINVINEDGDLVSLEKYLQTSNEGLAYFKDHIPDKEEIQIHGTGRLFDEANVYITIRGEKPGRLGERQAVIGSYVRNLAKKTGKALTYTDKVTGQVYVAGGHPFVGVSDDAVAILPNGSIVKKWRPQGVKQRNAKYTVIVKPEISVNELAEEGLEYTVANRLNYLKRRRANKEDQRDKMKRANDYVDGGMNLLKAPSDRSFDTWGEEENYQISNDVPLDYMKKDTTETKKGLTPSASTLIPQKLDTIPLESAEQPINVRVEADNMALLKDAKVKNIYLHGIAKARETGRMYAYKERIRTKDGVGFVKFVFGDSYDNTMKNTSYSKTGKSSFGVFNGNVVFDGRYLEENTHAREIVRLDEEIMLQAPIGIPIRVPIGNYGSMCPSHTLEEGSKPEPLQQIILHKNGVAEFERTYRDISEFRVPEKHMDMVLKTLRIYQNGRSIKFAMYKSPEHHTERYITFGVKTKSRSPLKISYMRNVPSWKSIYRLDLGKKNKGVLQRSALVTNDGLEDWTNTVLLISNSEPNVGRGGLYRIGADFEQETPTLVSTDFYLKKEDAAQLRFMDTAIPKAKSWILCNKSGRCDKAVKVNIPKSLQGENAVVTLCKNDNWLGEFKLTPRRRKVNNVFSYAEEKQCLVNIIDREPKYRLVKGSKQIRDGHLKFDLEKISITQYNVEYHRKEPIPLRIQHSKRGTKMTDINTTKCEVKIVDDEQDTLVLDVTMKQDKAQSKTLSCELVFVEKKTVGRSFLIRHDKQFKRMLEELPPGIVFGLGGVAYLEKIRK